MPVVTLRPDQLTEGIIGDKVRAFRSALAEHPNNSQLHSTLIAQLDTLRSTTVEQAQAGRKEWHKRHRRARFTEWPNDPDPDRRLRIGYVSPDFRRTSAAYAFAPVLLQHDRDHFEITCYAIKDKTEDPFRNIFRANVDFWRTPETVDDLIRFVREDEIDILVDLVGHIAGNVLPAFTSKPAPIQVSAWGCLAGTGCEEMDYLLSDPITTPHEDRAHYAEEIVDLPCALSYTPVPGCPDVGAPPSERNGFITFGFLGRLYKADDRTFQLWAEVLRQEPTAKLLLKNKLMDEEIVRGGLVRRFGQLGVTEDRLILRGQSLHKAHLETHNEVDIILDSFPQNGGISSLEAMWMGCPVVTYPEQGPHGRVGASLSNVLGLIYPLTPREYVLAALTYARDPELLREMRYGLRKMIAGSWLTRPARTIEDAYREMFTRWRASVGSV
jgi:predicted O-linked N-acetylglucosamine transferase (SPINDLY family)